MQENKSGTKVAAVMMQAKRGGWKAYRALVYGDQSLSRVCWWELLNLAVSGLGGAPGLFARSKLYPPLFGESGLKTVYGRNCVFRHTQKIRLGSGVIIDDNCLVDAKGESNRGITLGDRVYIGRNSSVYCKNGDILLADGVNISSSCTIMSSNRVEIGQGTVIGAYSYILSGGEYDYNSAVPFAEQTGTRSLGPLTIGKNCWLGARVTVLDGVNIGEHCVVGAGSLVTKSIPPNCLAVGSPARVIRQLV
jgi:acetyltransferase-like isoleucine patch superfamily enzyme